MVRESLESGREIETNQKVSASKRCDGENTGAGMVATSDGIREVTTPSFCKFIFAGRGAYGYEIRGCAHAIICKWMWS